MANKITRRPRHNRKADKFVRVLIWVTTKERIVDQLNARNRGQKVKQSLAGYIDDLSVI